MLPEYTIITRIGVYMTTSCFVLAQLMHTPNAEINILLIFGASAGFAALGGIAAAIRLSVKTEKWGAGNVISHALNMGCLGMFLSMLAVWYLEDIQITTGYAIIGFCGLCGLVGIPLIDPIAQLIQDALQRLFAGGVKKNDE